MAFFDCIVGGSGKGNTLVVTCADELAGATIACTNGTKTYTKTCPSTAPYEVTFYGLSAGTWTLSATVSGDTYTTTVVVADIEAALGGFNWKAWVDLSENYTSSDFTDLDDLLSDETAVRELMTIHACVDYLAGIAATSADVEKIIENDYCAKWINNRDYALDTLYANTIINGYMDTADKYFYGEWTLQPQVPTMTSNTAPYGEVFASSQYSASYQSYSAFDNDWSNQNHAWLSATNQATDSYLGYIFVEPVCVKHIKLRNVQNTGYLITSAKFQGSNDGITWTDIQTITITDTTPSAISDFDIENSTEYSRYRLLTLSWTAGEYCGYGNVQFYAWAPKGNVPVMTSANTPYGEVSGTSAFSTNVAAWKAFDQDYSTNWSSADNVTDATLSYKSVNPWNIRRVGITLYVASTTVNTGTFRIKGSNDGSTWENVSDILSWEKIETEQTFDIDNDNYYLYYAINFTSKTWQSGNTVGISIKEIQFYGRELSVSVPTMTGNAAPYGEASANKTIYGSGYAYKAFNNNSTGSGSCTLVYNASMSDGRVHYKFTSAKKILMAIYKTFSTSDNSRVKSARIVYSDDGTTWENASEVITFSASQTVIPINISEPHLYWGIGNIINGGNTGNVFVSELQFYGLDYSEKEFEEGTNKKWLYDHGVELETLDFGTAVKGDSYVYFNHINSVLTDEIDSHSKIDLTPYSNVRIKTAGRNVWAAVSSVYGFIAISNAKNVPYTQWSGYVDITPTLIPSYAPNNISYDISSFNEEKYISIGSTDTTGRKWDISEWWLE